MPSGCQSQSAVRGYAGGAFAAGGRAFMTIRADDSDLGALRAEVREFLRRQLPPDIAARARTGFHPGREDQQAWGRLLFEKGWGAPAWPIEFGGAGWTARQLQVFDEECYLAGAPELSWNGTRLLGPVLCRFGSPQQQQRFLPPTLRWEIFWGQGFSEPQSGSDLASLKTQAVSQGNEYVVNGSKIWMTDGHFADWLFCLVRTDATGRKQQGISFLLIDARSPGVQLRPIASIDHQHTLNQVFFTDVRVPKENRVGEEGAGWGYAKFLLTNERTSSAEVPRCKFYLQRLKQLAALPGHDGRPLGTSPWFAARLANLEVDLIALEASVNDALDSAAPAGEVIANASVLKLKGARMLQEMGELMVDAIGPHAIYQCDAGGSRHHEWQPPAHVPGITSDFLYRRASTIYGGSAEIQRNIIAAHLLPPGP
jgi:alkylation response protein AidB-like acyl-CoA dehydrogenase